MQQAGLFDAPVSPIPGLRYAPAFLTPEEEQALLRHIVAEPLQEAQYHQYTARRRVVSYGGRYDFSSQELLTAAPLPDWPSPPPGRPPAPPPTAHAPARHHCPTIISGKNTASESRNADVNTV